MAGLTGKDRYQLTTQLGRGTYGIVFKGTDRTKRKGDKDHIVAVKKIRTLSQRPDSPEDGVAVSALREIKLLQEVRHENIIGLLDVYAGPSNVYMVIELCITDLETVIQDRSLLLTPAEIKSCMLMILRGIQACHERWILHRDLKPGNILIGNDGNMKLADFGLARLHAEPNPRMTNQVITLWYRPPELLYAAKQYGPAVDMWSIGCIFAELMLRMPYLKGMNDVEQLARIFQARGTPTEEDWPDHDKLPAYVQFESTPSPDHRMIFSACSEAGLDMLNSMLHLNPQKRISAKDALEHQYFKEYPPPADKMELLQKIKMGKMVNGGGKNSDDEAKVSDQARAAGKRKLSFA